MTTISNTARQRSSNTLTPYELKNHKDSQLCHMKKKKKKSTGLVLSDTLVSFSQARSSKMASGTRASFSIGITMQKKVVDSIEFRSGAGEVGS